MTLPIPKLVTFYNGTKNVSDKVLYLSDSFPEGNKCEDSDVEVRVHMYNIRCGNDDWVSQCKPLAEYSWFIEEIRKNQKTMALEQAVDKAILDMPDDFEIKEFLTEHQSEVRNMCITEYDEAETMQMFKEEGEENFLIGQICRKLRKGKAVEEIADELEVDVVRVKIICDVADKYGPDYDENKVIDSVRQRVR